MSNELRNTKMFQCPHCEKRYIKETNLEKHVSVKHEAAAGEAVAAIAAGAGAGAAAAGGGGSNLRFGTYEPTPMEHFAGGGGEEERLALHEENRKQEHDKAVAHAGFPPLSAFCGKCSRLRDPGYANWGGYDLYGECKCERGEFYCFSCGMHDCEGACAAAWTSDLPATAGQSMKEGLKLRF